MTDGRNKVDNEPESGLAGRSQESIPWLGVDAVLFSRY